MSSTYLKRDLSATGNQKKWTFSAWIKNTEPTASGDRFIFSANNEHSGGGNYSSLMITATGALRYYNYSGGGTDNELITSRLLRDPNGWYHVLVHYDSANSTANDRIKFYINGVQETSFSTRSNPSQNYNSYIENNYRFFIGTQTDSTGSTSDFDGIMSHVYFINDQLYAPTVFGSTDSTTGEWRINTSPTYTPGTNGFLILKDGNTITDQSSNSNDFTLGAGTLTKTEDCPSNVFATYNPLVPYDGALAYTKGNTVVAYSGSGGDAWTTRWGVSSIGMTAGKYYAEAKVAAIGTNQMYALGLVKDVGTFAPTSSIGTDGVGYYSTGGIFKLSNQTQSGLATYTTNDIIGIAFDRDNGTVQWYKNGSAVGSAETGLSTDGTWFFVSNFYSSGKVAANFGNGYFEETAVSSAGTNASNIGIFEYDVPSGYTALCTKGLNE